MIEIGDTVEIIKEPFFLSCNVASLTIDNILRHFNGKKPIKNKSAFEQVDLKHLIGLKCKVIGFEANCFEPGDFMSEEKAMNSKKNGTGFYKLEVPKTKKGIPNGKLWGGFTLDEIKKI